MKGFALALEHYLTVLEKFSGSIVIVKEVNSENDEIAQWVVEGVPKPDELKLQQIVCDYNTYLDERAVLKQSLKTKVKTNLELTNDEFKLFVELIKES